MTCSLCQVYKDLELIYKYSEVDSLLSFCFAYPPQYSSKSRLPLVVYSGSDLPQLEVPGGLKSGSIAAMQNPCADRLALRLISKSCSSSHTIQLSVYETRSQEAFDVQPKVLPEQRSSDEHKGFGGREEGHV